MTNVSEMILLSGNSHPDLAELVASRLSLKLGDCSVIQSTNKETTVQIGDSVRGKDVYIIQTGSKDVNNNIMELLIMAYACKTSDARNIVGVIPYLPYSKQSLTHVITMDLHMKEVQGFFDIPVDNLRASPFLLQYIQECIPDYRNAIIVAKDPGSAKKATSYAERLRLGIAVIHGEQKDEEDQVDGRYSPPAVSGVRTVDVGLESVPVLGAKEKPPINVVGDVSGRIAIMVDDMVDDVASFVAAAEVLQERGAYKIYVLATHWFTVVVTNTIPHARQKMQCHKIKTVDISILISEAIRRIHNKESMSYLFRNVTLDD
ncbi:Phosphoribosyl pyrophosphate synthase-associated protein 2 [Nymphon striatum]|nr:Phosphoribosyl pyrophosphate synthase-associated protein 2 [Nymphon striatum]